MNFQHHLEFKIRGNMNGIKYPCIVDLKYDGHLVMVSVINGNVTLTKKSGITSSMADVNILKSGSKMLRGYFLAELIVDGGRLGTFQDVTSSMKSRDRMLKIFDIAGSDSTFASSRDMISGKTTLLERKEILSDNVNDIYLAETHICDNEEQVFDLEKQSYEIGYEGIVVKNIGESIGEQKWVKVKKEDEIECSVMDINQTNGTMKVLLNGDTGSTGMLTIKNPCANTLRGMVVYVKHQGFTNSGIPRNAVCVRIPALYP